LSRGIAFVDDCSVEDVLAEREQEVRVGVFDEGNGF
jgi:hypothetical protein